MSLSFRITITRSITGSFSIPPRKKGYIFPQDVDQIAHGGQRGREAPADPVDVPQALFFRNFRKNRACIMCQCQRTIAVQTKAMLMFKTVSSALWNITGTAAREGFAVVG